MFSAHVPNGLHCEELFWNCLDLYAKISPAEENIIVESDGSVSATKPNKKKGNTSPLRLLKRYDNDKRYEGTVSSINYTKNYGFIRLPEEKGRSSDMFFHFSQFPSNVSAKKGDAISFLIEFVAAKNKNQAVDLKLLDDHLSQPTSSACLPNMIRLKAFSMNQPFAALLANGYKTLETRNNTMFANIKPGTKMLLHVGQRNYPDGDRHLQIMKDDSISQRDIHKLKSLSQNFTKGMLVAILEIGDTVEVSLEDRSKQDFERKVVAYGKDSGRIATEIKRVDYLKLGVKMSGKGGVFDVDVDQDVIPYGWL